MSSEFPAIPYPWQQPQWQHFMGQRDSKKLSHAFMFTGQKGIGKRHLALALAHTMLCNSPQSQLPCGQCRGCELNRANTHPDFMLLEPEEAGKAIKIDQVRTLSNFIAKTSQQGGYKVAVIEPAEAMNINAANALLKSLEEPAGNTLLVLISHVTSGVMATIRSRCQLQVLSAPLPQQGLEWLQPLVGEADAAELLGLAAGAPLAALELASGDALEQRAALIQGLESVAGGVASALDIAKQWMSYEPRELVEWLLKWLHSMACVQSGGESLVEFSPAMQQMSENLDGPILYRYIDKVMSVKQQLLSGANPNKQLLLEELLMDWGALTRQVRKAG